MPVIVMDLILILNGCLLTVWTSHSRPPRITVFVVVAYAVGLTALRQSHRLDLNSAATAYYTKPENVGSKATEAASCSLLFVLVEIEDPWRRSRAREHRLCGLRVRRRFVYLKWRFQPTVSPPHPAPTQVICTKKKKNPSSCVWRAEHRRGATLVCKLKLNLYFETVDVQVRKDGRETKHGVKPHPGGWDRSPPRPPPSPPLRGALEMFYFILVDLCLDGYDQRLEAGGPLLLARGGFLLLPSWYDCLQKPVGFEPPWSHSSLKAFLEKKREKSQIESIFVHFKLCNAHHLFLLTERKERKKTTRNKCSLTINLSNSCIMTSNRWKK